MKISLTFVGFSMMIVSVPSPPGSARIESARFETRSHGMAAPIGYVVASFEL